MTLKSAQGAKTIAKTHAKKMFVAAKWELNSFGGQFNIQGLSQQEFIFP